MAALKRLAPLYNQLYDAAKAAMVPLPGAWIPSRGLAGTGGARVGSARCVSCAAPPRDLAPPTLARPFLTPTSPPTFTQPPFHDPLSPHLTPPPPHPTHPPLLQPRRWPP